MKVFVSGQVGEKERIREMYEKLLAAGFELTHDWTQIDSLRPKEYQQSSEEAGIRAQRDIKGVCDADIYIIMTDNRDRGRGMCIELGAALALAEVRGVPKVFVVGPKNHASMFYYHPLAQHFADIEACIEHISAQKTRVNLPG